MPRITAQQTLEKVEEQGEIIAALANAQAEQAKEARDQLKALTALVAIIAESLQQLAQFSAPPAPNYRSNLGEYAGFDWSKIGARVTAEDSDGATVVHWNGHQWKRRSGSGKFGRAIWFNRPEGRDEEGNVQYLRLITFKDLDQAEPLTFERPDPDNGHAQEPAEAAHLKYQDGSAVPPAAETIQIFNAFMYAHRRKPKDSEELKTWHYEQEELRAANEGRLS